MKNKLGYVAGAIACLLLAVYGVLLALDVQFLFVLQVQDTVGEKPPNTLVLRSVATVTPEILPQPVPTPFEIDKVPDLLSTAVPLINDLLNGILGIP